jgi:predicted DsbA family dithiol-disulfide isomerase
MSIKYFQLLLVFILCIAVNGHTKKKSISVITLPGTTITSLSLKSQKFIMTTMDAGECPCDPSKNLLQCIQKELCPKATRLAQFAIDKLKEGLNEEQVTDAVIDKYMADFVPPATFKLDHSPYKGDEKGLIHIVEFADFECPQCVVVSQLLKRLLEKYSKGVKVYFKNFPLAKHKYAHQAALAALAAHKQNKFWQMHDLIFAQQSKLQADHFITFAAQLKLDLIQFKNDMINKELQKEIKRQQLEGIQAHLKKTPTLFFNGHRYDGELTLVSIEKYMKQMMQDLNIQNLLK